MARTTTRAGRVARVPATTRARTLAARRRPLVSRLAVAPLLGVALLAGTACGQVGPAPAPPGPQADTPDADDQRYGAAPAPNPAVTYQPDVVFVGGGGGSVRGLSEDALTWRIDAAASGADKVAPGKIMFLTGRAVGRVLATSRDGDDLAVTLGPVDITEVIRDGTFVGDSPVSFDSPRRYDAGTPFWSEIDADNDLSQDGAGGGAGGGGGGSAGGGGGGSAGGFAVTPICCSGGAGAEFTYDGGDIRLAGKVLLLMKSPSASFHLEIRGSSVRRAELRVRGMVGLRVEIAGATNSGRNVNKRIPVPIDFSVPIGEVLGVPFSATLNQLVGVQTAFSAKDGNLKAAGEWSLGGELGFGYANGQFGATQPWRLSVRESITDSIFGPSVGVNGIVLHHQATFRIGLGVFGFTAGLYTTVTTTVGLTVGSALGAPIELCRSTQLGLWLDYGVGYTIPASLVKAVNVFLQLINARPIDAKGGIGRVENVFNKLVVQPDVKICRG